MEQQILITGATGNFGSATINFLLQKGIPANHISALARDENKAANLKAKGIQIKTGSYDNYDSLLKAFQGVDKLLLVSGNDIANRTQQQKNVVDAAKSAGVKHIIYTSVERKNETASSPVAMITESHLATEQFIKDSGIAYTLLRNNLYLDTIPMFVGENVLKDGIYFPAGETPASFASRSDMAEAAANVLTAKGHENKAYGISNTESISFSEIARHLSHISGNAVPYVSPEAKAYTETLAAAGLPFEYIGMFAGFAEGIKQGEFHAGKSDLEQLLGRKPVGAKAFLEGIYAKPLK